MTLIEGVGDEVTNFMVVMIVIIIGILSWWSTSITEQPLIRTVLILEPHNRHRTVGTVRTATVTASTSAEDTGQSEPLAAERSHSETASDRPNQNVASNETKLEKATANSKGNDLNPVAGSSFQPASVQASTSCSSSNQSADLGANNPGASVQASNDPYCHDSGKSELRRRRLQFFQEKQEVSEVEKDEEESSVNCKVDHDKSKTNTCFVESNQTDTSSSQEILHAHALVQNDCPGDNEPVALQPVIQESENTSERYPEAFSSEQSPADDYCCCDSEAARCSGSQNICKNVLNSEDTSADVDGIRIRLKYLNDNQKLVQGKLQEPLGDFKRRHFALEMEGNKVVRLIFNGQVLHSDDQTLQNYGLFDNCVVHCLVHTRRTTTSNADAAPNTNNSEDVSGGGNAGGAPREWDLSQLLYIGLSGILTMAWILRFSNPHLFSAASTIALFGLTGIYIISVVGMYIPDPEGLRT